MSAMTATVRVRPIPPAQGEPRAAGAWFDGKTRIELEHAVAQALEESDGIVQAAPRIIRAICERLQWACGARWEPEPLEETVVRAEAWGLPDPTVQAFLDASQRLAPSRDAGGLNRRAWVEGKPVCIRDVTCEATFRRSSEAARAGLRGAYAFQIHVDGRVIGVMEFFSRRIEQADAQLLECMGYVGGQIGRFMQRERIEQLVGLEHAVTRCLAAPVAPSVALKSMMQVVCEGLGWECGRFFRLDEKAALLRHEDSWGLPSESIQEFLEAARKLSYARGEGLVGQTWETGKPIWVNDIAKDGRVRHGLARKAGLHGAFLFPVMAAGRMLGVLNFQSRQARRSDERLLESINVIGSQVGQFLQRAQAEQELRESERRFRSLTLLSSDTYWEQDDQHRFTLVNGAHELRRVHSTFIGKRRWEVGFANMTPGDWAAHIATLDAREPFHDLELCYLDDDGEIAWVRVSGEPVFDADGVFQGYRGVGKRITERKLEEHLLNLEHAVTRTLAQASESGPALKSVIRAICESQGWDCGRYFHADEGAGVLRFVEAWGMAEPAIAEYIESSRDRHASLDSGVKARVWRTGEPSWRAEHGGRGRLLQEALGARRGAFVCAVAGAGRSIGVLSFSCPGARAPNARFLRAVRSIGSQICQFLQRQQAEADLREGESRFRSLTALSSDFYWETDEEHRFVRAEYGRRSQRRVLSDGFVGKTRWELPSTSPGPEGWAAHRAVLEARRPFRDFAVARIGADGAERHLSISGEPIFDDGGRFKGYRGVGRDITARRREERLLQLEHRVTRMLSESGDEAATVRAVLSAIGESQGWDCGRYFVADVAAGLLRFGEGWGIDDPAVQRYLDASRVYTSPLDSGSKAEVWRSGEPHWGPEMSRRSRLAHDIFGRARDSIACAVSSEGRSMGVLSFTSRQVREPDERLLQALRVIGSQLGQFLQRKQAEAAMRRSEARFRSLTELSSDVYWEQDAEFRFTAISGRGAGKDRLGGLPFLGHALWELETVNVGEEDWARHRARLEAREPFVDLELCRVEAHGHKSWISMSGEPVFEEDGTFAGYRGIGKDITARKQDEERIGYLASHDALTGLPNRSRFSETLRQAILTARRYLRSFAVLFIDLDRFKVINDTLGHQAGDELLRQVCSRITGAVRSSDIVARLGGDEFVVLVQEVADARQVETVARKILSAVTPPMTIHGHECTVTASIGICMFPGDADDEETLMRNADIAMYRAKDDGKNTYSLYRGEGSGSSFKRIALESRMRRAIELGEFFLHYQAKLSLHTGRITGVEALVRWAHPELGVVMPGDFIALAEETGLIVPLGRWILREACAQNVAWQRAGLPELRMAVNLSARQFADGHLLEDIAAALRETGMRPELLELELTENTVMQDLERAAAILAAIKALGVRLAIDDFGVGYSSLNHLKNFPIDTLKVDGSFIRDIPQAKADRAIAEAIIAMGKSLDLTVVAEGVETPEQEAFLREHACDETQGFYFSRPAGAEPLTELLLRHFATPHDGAAA